MPPGADPGAQARFFESLSLLIRAIRLGDIPGVLFLDDVQWADDASLDLLTYIVRRMRGQPLLVLVTWRGKDVGSGHRLRRLLAEAERNAYGELLHLTRLPGPILIRELVGVVAAQAGQVTPAFTEQLYQETEGLPFFIFEYLASFPEGREDFALTGWPLPHGVRDLLHRAWTRSARQAYSYYRPRLAIGRSFDFDTLREASGRTDEETVYTLETLIHRGLIREALPGLEINSPESLRLLSYDFNHEKLRQLVYGETSLARKRLLHLRIAESLVGRSRGRRTSPVLPGKLLSTTNRQARLGQSCRVLSNRWGASALLIRQRRSPGSFSSCPCTGASGNCVSQRSDWRHAHAARQLRLCHPKSLEVALAQQFADPTALARLRQKLGDVFHRLGDWERAEACFQVGAETLSTESNPGALARLYGDWSRTLYRRGDMDRAWQMAGQALALAEEVADIASWR